MLTEMFSIPVSNPQRLALGGWETVFSPTPVLDHMRLDELDLPAGVADLFISDGILELYPPQERAVPMALDGRSLVVAIPTASGKSLIGYLAALRHVLELGGKVLYIVPLRALAAEKFEDLSRFKELGVRVAVSMGDFDGPDPRLDDVDIIVATSEKADSMMRHRSDWVQSISLVVTDEVHLIHDPSRGPTLEVTLTKMRLMNPELQVIALSATISNAEELAEWLDSELVASQWRPTPLKEGIYYEGEIKFVDGSRRKVPFESDAVWSLVKDSVTEGGQCLVFVNSRRSTESLSSRHAARMGQLIDAGDDLKVEGGGLLDLEAEPTSMAQKLASCLSHGIAFHHAGLTNAQRRQVERMFKERRIKCIVATPTLAAGINLPARRVVVRDIMRFEGSGMVPIPVLEVKQMCGRAGRPGYDPYGEAVLIATNETQQRMALEEYLLNDTETIYSKLGTEPALRSHVLALVATETAGSREEVKTFFASTFFAHQADLWSLEATLDHVIDMLVEEGMLLEGDRLSATFFGRRVSDLYIDPMSAIVLRNALDRFGSGKELGVLHAVCATPDMLTMYLRRNDYETMESIAINRAGELLRDPPEDLSEYDFFLSELKTSMVLEMWMQEVEEERILETFNIGPGDLRNKVDTANWLVYSMRELATIFNKDAHASLTDMMIRVKNGVRSELLELVKVRHVGRARARMMYSRGIRDVDTLKSTTVEELAVLPGMGTTLARRILDGVTNGKPRYGGVPSKMMEPDVGNEPEEEVRSNGQACLFDF